MDADVTVSVPTEPTLSDSNNFASNCSMDEVDYSCASAHSNPEIDDNKSEDSTSLNVSNVESGSKRQRKKVQRLSETWNRAHEKKAEERAKALKEASATLENGTGIALGDIPLIDATIRKVKPADLKVLHLVIFGRPGAVNEIRSNLRKFRGFGFPASSSLFEKKLSQIRQRTAADIRESLRILNLEVSGTREQLALRLMEFLHKPSAGVVKYKGKVVIRSRNRNKSKGGESSKKIGPRRPSSKKAIDDTMHTEGTSSDNDDNQSSPDVTPSESHVEDNVASDLSSSVSSDVPKKKARKRVSASNVNITVSKRSRKRTISDSDDNELAPDSSTVKPTDIVSQKTESDEDAPLSTLAATKSSEPSDEQLKNDVISLLKVVNLEETSLKLVREKIFALYPDVDLSSKKDFINSTVKKFLSQP